jgi:hypothetical protein
MAEPAARLTFAPTATPGPPPWLACAGGPPLSSPTKPEGRRHHTREELPPAPFDSGGRSQWQRRRASTGREEWWGGGGERPDVDWESEGGFFCPLSLAFLVCSYAASNNWRLVFIHSLDATFGWWTIVAITSFKCGFIFSKLIFISLISPN